MNPVHGILLSFVLLLIQSASCCNPVNEFENRSVTATNTSHLMGYQLPPCPTLYRLASIVRAELSNPATPQSNPLNITDLLTNVCLSRNLMPCTVDIHLNGLDVSVRSTILNVKVNYTCQLDDPDWIRNLMATSEKTFSYTSWVKYIRVKLTGAEIDWKCTISTSGGGAVSWSWMLENCPMNALGCMNRTLVMLPRQSDTFPLCMEPRSIAGIWFITEKFCDATLMSYASIVIDIQVPLASDFDIVCNAETPSNIAAKIQNLTDPQLDPLKAKCSQLIPTRPMSSTSKDLSTSTSRITLARNSDTSTTLARNSETSTTTLARNSETTVGTADMAKQFHTPMQASRLGLGLGLGLGLLVVISAVALSVVCIRRKNRGFDTKRRTLSDDKADVGGATAEKDGGFVLATDVFVVKNIYSEISEVNLNPNPTKQIQVVQVKSSSSSDINKRNGVQGPDVPTDETAENRYDQEPTPATSASPGDRKPKRASSLSRKLFKQIAALAKQEERQSQIPNGGVAGERPEGAVEMGGSETSIVDRWLYSSSLGLNSAEDTLRQNNDNGGIYINRRFEIDA